MSNLGNEKVPGQVLYILKILMEIMEVEVVGRLQGRGTEENQLWKSLNANICNTVRWSCSKFSSKYRIASYGLLPRFSVTGS